MVSLLRLGLFLALILPGQLGQTLAVAQEEVSFKVCVTNREFPFALGELHKGGSESSCRARDFACGDWPVPTLAGGYCEGSGRLWIANFTTTTTFWLMLLSARRPFA